MASSAKCMKPKLVSANEDWTVVTRRGKQTRRNFPMAKTIEQQPWTSSDLDIDPERESKLTQKMQSSIRKVEKSDFYCTFLDQMQTHDVLNYFSRTLVSESKMQMVIYGIGSLESYETPRLQLSLAILIKRRFNWIGDIEVFDPVLSKTEIRVLEALGCSFIPINEQGRRCALKPTLFFMPHCEAMLYDNLLQANWRAENLNQMVLFGNSFSTYEQHALEFKNSSVVDSSKFVRDAQKFSVEIPISMVEDDFFRPFHDSSWHFFKFNPETEIEDSNECQVCGSPDHLADKPCPFIYTKCSIEGCNGLGVLKVAHTPLNNGRKFLKCQNLSCVGFKWLDETIIEAQGLVGSSIFREPPK